jgi:hypothetical protein
MPRYFMHLIDHTDVILDPEGVELALKQVSSATLEAARDCMAGDVHNGQLDLRYRIEVQDENGTTVHRLPFAEAVEILTSS